MLFAIFVLTGMLLLVYLDDKFKDKELTLGEEWDFTKPHFNPKQ